MTKVQTEKQFFPFVINSLCDRGQTGFCKNLLVNLFEPGISPCKSEFPDIKIKRQSIEHYLKNICSLTQQYGIYTIKISRSWIGQFLSTDSFNLYSASRLLTSDSENAFLFFENLFRVICLCLLIIFLFIVCRFVRIYPTVCVCGVITRSYFWLSISQLCSTIVCLFRKFFNDVSFRMRDARNF